MLNRAASSAFRNSPCLSFRRSHSILAEASGSRITAQYPSKDQQGRAVLGTLRRPPTPRNDRTGTTSSSSQRLLSKYASVDHASAYEESMAASHGVQLQLALEEGRGKDDAPFDPFSQFLDQMGNSTEEDGNGGGELEEGIQEADYEDYDSEEGDDEEGEGEEESDEEDGPPVYTTAGALYRPKSERLALRAGYPAGGQFAVIHLAGFQHKVTVDDLLVVNKLKPVSDWSVGSTHTIRDDDVLLMASRDKTLVGVPGVSGAEVDLMVEEITRDKTLIVFKKRRRKHSRRKNGFRRQVTFLRVLDVRMPEKEVEQAKNRDDGRDDLDQDVQLAA